MRKIGIIMQAKKGLTDEEYVAFIRELGFEATFTGVPNREKAAEWRALFDKYGIAWETMHAPFKHINDIWLDTPGGKEMYEELIDSVDRCHEFGVPTLIIHLSSGERPPQISDIGRARFASLIEYAGGKGIKLAFENQRKLANISYIFETYWDATHVGFCYDNGHEGCFTYGRQYMTLFGDRLSALHLHDNEAIYNKDSHLLPFDGSLDFERITRQIRESGYTGSVMLEVLPKNSNRYDDMDCKVYLTRAAEAAKRLRDMIDGPQN